jgi:Gluconate 2-dehydrogenase subunit 3
VKRLDALGEKERAIVEERRRTGYRVDRLERFGGELEPQLRAVVRRLLPSAGSAFDLVSFVDGHVEHTLGRGDHAPGAPPASELVRTGLEALAARGFGTLAEDEQDELIGRMRRGEADVELGFLAKDFIDRLLALALAGYLAHPATWDQIGFNGPAYPEGYAWISSGAVAQRHVGITGADRL